MKNNWQIKKLGEIIVENKKSILKSKGNKEGVYPFFVSGYNIKNINKYLINEESIFLPTGGSFFIHYFNGKAAYSTDTWSIKTSKDANIRFLYYFLNLNEDFIGKKLFKGATIKHLQKNDFRNLKIPLPPLPEQHRIVKILDEVFENITKAKENIEKNLQNSKEIFESYLNNIFKNLGKNWKEEKLKDIGSTQTGTTPKTAEKENYGNFIPFIKPADVNFSGIGDIRYNNEGLSELGLKRGRKIKKSSILMVCIGATIGKVGFVKHDVSSNQQINSLTVKNEFEPKFIYYSMTSKQFQSKVLAKGKSSQATLPIINKSKWENLTISFPKSKTEQQTIVYQLDTLQAQTKKLEEIYKQKLADLEELKKSILKKAFEGKL